MGDHYLKSIGIVGGVIAMAIGAALIGGQEAFLVCGCLLTGISVFVLPKLRLRTQQTVKPQN